MLAEKDPYIESAYQRLQIISQDKEKRLEYEAREKAIRDHNQFLKEARQNGHEEGRKEGIEEGRKEGIEEGRKEGIEEGRKEGIERINKLFALLIKDNRYDDLKHSATDADFQNSLLKEYGI